MNSVVEAYKARKEIEEQGIWCVILGGKIKIRHGHGNKDLANKMQKINDPSKNMSEDEMFAEIVLAAADHVVLDWEGFDEDYSRDYFIKMCEELKEHGFVQDVMAHAVDVDMLNQIAIAKTAKN